LSARPSSVDEAIGSAPVEPPDVVLSDQAFGNDTDQPNGRAHDVGNRRQLLNMVTYALGVNALSMHVRRQGRNRVIPASWPYLGVVGNGLAGSGNVSLWGRVGSSRVGCRRFPMMLVKAWATGRDGARLGPRRARIPASWSCVLARGSRACCVIHVSASTVSSVWQGPLVGAPIRLPSCRIVWSSRRVSSYGGVLEARASGVVE
jgi:hypothetical protein